jgi:hypothetical protein
VGKSEQERNKLFSFDKDKYPKGHQRILEEYISKPELWDLWNFLGKEKDAIFGITDWEIYRRAAGTDVEKIKINFPGKSRAIYEEVAELAKRYLEYGIPPPPPPSPPT